MEQQAAAPMGREFWALDKSCASSGLEQSMHLLVHLFPSAGHCLGWAVVTLLDLVIAPVLVWGISGVPQVAIGPDEGSAVKMMLCYTTRESGTRRLLVPLLKKTELRV